MMNNQDKMILLLVDLAVVRNQLRYSDDENVRKSIGKALENKLKYIAQFAEAMSLEELTEVHRKIGILGDTTATSMLSDVMTTTIVNKLNE